MSNPIRVNSSGDSDFVITKDHKYIYVCGGDMILRKIDLSNYDEEMFEID